METNVPFTIVISSVFKIPCGMSKDVTTLKTASFKVPLRAQCDFRGDAVGIESQLALCSDGVVWLVVGSHLGRACGPCSRVIFYETDLSSVIDPRGWDAWNYTQQTNDSFLYHNVNFMSCIFYRESSCTGAGANTSQRFPWTKNLTNSDLNGQFSMSVFINSDDLIPQLPLK
ncbi:putative pectinesterase 52, partial [Mucuna pruriens]